MVSVLDTLIINLMDRSLLPPYLLLLEEDTAFRLNSSIWISTTYATRSSYPFGKAGPKKPTLVSLIGLLALKLRKQVLFSRSWQISRENCDIYMYVCSINWLKVNHAISYTKTTTGKISQTKINLVDMNQLSVK